VCEEVCVLVIVHLIYESVGEMDKVSYKPIDWNWVEKMKR